MTSWQQSSSAAGRTRHRLGNTSTCPQGAFRHITKSPSTAGLENDLLVLLSPWATLLDILFATNCSWKPAKHLGLTFLSLPRDDIPRGGYVVSFLNLVERENSLYSFWVDLDTKTEIAIWGLLILFLLCLVPPSWQSSLLGKMAGKHKEICESISVVEHPLFWSSVGFP